MGCGPISPSNTRLWALGRGRSWICSPVLSAVLHSPLISVPCEFCLAPLSLHSLSGLCPASYLPQGGLEGPQQGLEETSGDHLVQPFPAEVSSLQEAAQESNLLWSHPVQSSATRHQSKFWLLFLQCPLLLLMRNPMGPLFHAPCRKQGSECNQEMGLRAHLRNVRAKRVLSRGTYKQASNYSNSTSYHMSCYP